MALQIFEEKLEKCEDTERDFSEDIPIVVIHDEEPTEIIVKVNERAKNVFVKFCLKNG